MIPIDDIREKVRGASDDARFEAWMMLYASVDPEAEEELRHILGGKDPVLKILLARFLAHVHEERAVLFIREMLYDDNPVVVESAKKAFDRNLYETKLHTLLPVLHIPSVFAQTFIIERIGSGGVKEAVEPLLKILKTADPTLMLQILSAFRYLTDKVLINELMPYFSHTDENIRFKVLLVYGSLYEEGDSQARNFLTRALKDASSRIRQTALWSLRRKPEHRNLKFFFQHAEHDPDPTVRQESLLGFSSYPTKKVIRKLLDILVHDASRMVFLKGEAVLLTMPTRKLVQGLKYVLKKPNQSIVNKALKLFAEFQKDSRSYYNYLVRGLKNTSDIKLKISFIETLGILERREALKVLEEHLDGHALIIYAAMSSITKIWRRDAAFPALRYLQNEKLSLLIKQMVLKHLIKIELQNGYDRNLTDHLVGLLRHENLNMRYLAAQALCKAAQSDMIEPLFEMMLKETDSSSVKYIRESVGAILMHNPERLPMLLESHRGDALAVTQILLYLKDMPLSADDILQVLLKLVADENNFLTANFLDGFAGVLCQFLSLRRLKLGELLDAIRGCARRDEVLGALIAKLRAQPVCGISLDVWNVSDEIRRGEGFKREYLVEVLSYGEGPAVMTALIAILCDDALVDCRGKAAECVRRLVGEAA